MNYGFVIDTDGCIGCHACSTACKSENDVPLGVYRTWVKHTEVGTYPDVRRTFQVTRCNHCANPPCVAICPTAAMHRRPDGIVDFASDACIGCKACTQACPYDAIHLDPSSHTAAKCNFCAHRIEVGLEPACVVVCPEHAILAGDLDDPGSEVARALARHPVTVRKPEQGTSPKLFYIGGTRNRPVAGRPSEPGYRHPPGPPVGGNAAAFRPSPRMSGFQWADRRAGAHPSDAAPAGPSVAAVRVGYDVEHAVQWHWPIPAYLVTKHIAGGTFAWLALAVLLRGDVPRGAMLGGGGLGLVMLAVTLGLLIYDLDRPDRFFYLFVRPQWRSWVARAAWILAAFSAVAGAWWVAELAVPDALGALRPLFAVLALPLGALAAVYTAFLFAQAEGRDLWQSPHLAGIMALHAAALGAAPFAAFGGVWGVSAGDVAFARAVVAGALAAAFVGIVVADHAVAPATDVARAGLRTLVAGRYAGLYRIGLGVGHVVPIALCAAQMPVADVLAFAAAAGGLFAYAVALVMAPQTVPNA